MRSQARHKWLMFVVVGVLFAACGTDEEPAADSATVEQPERQPDQEPQPDQPQPDQQPDQPQPDQPQPDQPEPECGFLECGGDAPDGVEGVIDANIVIPGPPCLGTDALAVFPDDAVQGGQLSICMPEAVTRLAPYDITITGPNGVVFDESRETPEGIPPVLLSLEPARFSVGSYEVNVTQVQDFLIDDSLEFSVDLATTPHLLGESISRSSVRIWITGDDANASVEVDFYTAAAEGCAYRGTETIATDGNGVGSEEFQTAGLPSGSYFAFSRSVGARRCNVSDFIVS